MEKIIYIGLILFVAYFAGRIFNTNTNTNQIRLEKENNAIMDCIAMGNKTEWCLELINK